VEGEERPVSSDYLVPVPSVQHLEELNLLLLSGAVEQQSRMIRGRTQTIGAVMIAEQESSSAPGP